MHKESSKNPHLDTITQKFIKRIEGAKPIYELTPLEARHFLKDLQYEYAENVEAYEEDFSISTELAGEINIRMVKPTKHKDEKLPVIIYCHGGGWVMGCAEAYDMTIKMLAGRAEAALIFVNYNRSPEFHYPNATNQIYETLKYFYENASEYNLDAERIALVGDSVGGNMAAVTSIRAKYNDGPKISFQALICPVTDAGMDTDSYNEFKDGPWLTKKAMEYFWDCYTPDKKVRDEISVSPINATVEDLKDLPPTLILTAENDVLRDEGEAFARNLIAAGVDVACLRVNNTCHDFFMLNALKQSKAVKASYKLVCDYLKSELHC